MQARQSMPQYDDWEPETPLWLGSSTLLLLIVVFLVLVIVWASYFELDQVTRAQGRVIPSKQVQVVENLEGGIVREILVSRGDRVKAGQILLKMDPTRFDAEYRRGQEDYYALLARIERLKAEISNVPLKFSAKVQATVPEVMAAEMVLYRTRRDGLEARLKVLASQLDQRKKAIEEARATFVSSTQSLQLAEAELTILDPLVKRGLESKVESIRARMRAATARGERDTAALAIDRHAASITEVESQIVLTDQEYRTATMEDLSNSTRELNSLLKGIPALEDRVARTEVRSPVTGIVNQVHVTTVGGVAQPGEPLVEVVPLDDTLLIEAEIRPGDIAFLAPGQASRVKITAYDYSLYGMLEAKLEHLSADAITKKDGDSVYQAHVRTNQAYLTAGDDKLPILPGMVAEVDILTGKQTIVDYILSPLTNIAAKALTER